MNKALVLLEALATIQTKITDGEWYGDNEGLILNIHSIAEEAVNMVGGHEEIDFLYENLRCKAIDLDVAETRIRDYSSLTGEDVKKLVDAVIPVLVAVDDLTDGGVSNA